MRETDHGLNPEDFPGVRLHTTNGEFLATPENTTLYTFMGKLALYDHIFMVTSQEETESTVTGTYLFNQNPVYPELADFLAQNDYPLILNRLEVPECDVRAFDNMVHQDAGDFDTIPEDWT